MKRNKREDEIILYIIKSPEGTKIYRISYEGLRKVIRAELEGRRILD